MNGKLVCHTGIIQAPLRKGFKQVHRLVVLPDYQGIGIGTKFITFIAKQYAEQDLTVKLITTTPAIRFSLDKSEDWILHRSGRVVPNGNKTYFKKRKSESSTRITYSYFFTNGYSCHKCGKVVNKGYLINGVDYYCSDECLKKDYPNGKCDMITFENKNGDHRPTQNKTLPCKVTYQQTDIFDYLLEEEVKELEEWKN